MNLDLKLPRELWRSVFLLLFPAPSFLNYASPSEGGGRYILGSRVYRALEVCTLSSCSPHKSCPSCGQPTKVHFSKKKFRAKTIVGTGRIRTYKADNCNRRLERCHCSKGGCCQHSRHGCRGLHKRGFFHHAESLCRPIACIQALHASCSKNKSHCSVRTFSAFDGSI